MTETARTSETLNAPTPGTSAGEIAVFQRARLPWHDHIERTFGTIGVTKSTWKALIDAVFPAAKSVDSVVLALSYCKARKLDPFKRPVHIVPVWDSERNCYVDTVWPGISELRTTAVRTGVFAGVDTVIHGPDKEYKFSGEAGRDKRKRDVTLTVPEWAQITVYRLIAGQRVAIQGPRVYWLETYATIGRTELPNAMWEKRPRGQLEKCAEAAALRRAFPEEIGNEYAAEEMEGRNLGGGTGEIIDAVLVSDKKPERADFQTQPKDAKSDAKPAEPEQFSEEDQREADRLQRAAAEAEPAQASAAEAEQKPAEKGPLDDYFDKMLAEFRAQKSFKDKSLVLQAFMDRVNAAAERKEITAQQSGALIERSGRPLRNDRAGG